MSTIHLVPEPSPDLHRDDLAQRMASRTARERNLRAAFAAVIEYDGWTPALESLASECEEMANEARGWSDTWMMRQAAFIELSGDRDLRGE